VFPPPTGSSEAAPGGHARSCERRWCRTVARRGLVHPRYRDGTTSTALKEKQRRVAAYSPWARGGWMAKQRGVMAVQRYVLSSADSRKKMKSPPPAPAGATPRTVPSSSVLPLLLLPPSSSSPLLPSPLV
jgi:hypothetical protein